MKWFTSDLHFGHVNISRFCNRPFLIEGEPDTDWMNTTIIDTINSLVGPDDELWVLGDAAMGRIDDTLPLRGHLHAGTVFLVPGNHDRCHPMHPKANQWVQRYEDAGWVIREPDTHTTVNSPANGNPPIEVRLNHFPFTVDPAEARSERGETVDKFSAWRPVDDGGWLLCGHVHDTYRQSGRAINVGIDAWGGQPVSEVTVAGLIEAGERDLSSLAWPGEA